MGTLYHKDSDTTDMHKIAGYIQASDPGAIGAGKAWIDTTGGTGAWILKVRNATNAGWEAAGGEGFLKLDQTTPQSVINGKPTVQGFNFAIAPTVGSYAEGKLYYDEVWKCLSLNCGRDVNLQIGQEDLRRVYNDTGATIYEGNAVYSNGAYTGGTNDTVTVAYARADSETTAFALGVATQDIPDEDYGFITVRGHVNNLNTNAIGGSYVSTQGMFIASKIGGVASNAYTFTVVNTGSGGLSYTEIGDAFTLDIGGVVNPTAADVAAEIYAHYATASIMAQATTPATVVVVAGAVSLANGVDTAAGDVLYLSAVVAGGLTTIAPEGPNLKIRIGRLITKSATVGRINVRIVQSYRLNDLANVSVPSPTTDDILKWNGTEWVNGPGGTVSAGPGIEFFNASPTIIAKSNQNQFPLLTLSKTPVVTAEQTITGTGDSSSTPIPFAAWLYNTALARTSIDAGLWEFSCWANISNASGTTTITRNVYAVLDETVGTVMITTEGGDTTTSRTATATDGTPFAAAKINVGGTALTDSYLKTTKGMHRILSWVSDKVVKVSTISTYTNDVAGMAFGVWKKAVSGVASADINTTTASGTYQALTGTVAASAYAITVAHKLGAICFVTSTASRVVTVTYDGTERNTHIATPLITLHGNLAGLQGGQGSVPAEEYWHLKTTEHTAATRDATNSQNGLMPTAKLTGWDAAAAAVHTQGTDTALGTQAENLDMGTFAITNVGNVDGRDVSADGTKLDAIAYDSDYKTVAAGGKKLPVQENSPWQFEVEDKDLTAAPAHSKGKRYIVGTVAPTQFTTWNDNSGASSAGDTRNGISLREVLGPTNFDYSGTQVRISVFRHATYTYVLNWMHIAEVDGGDDRNIVDGTKTTVTWDTGSASKSVTNGSGSFASDWITFAFTKTKKYAITYYVAPTQYADKYGVGTNGDKRYYKNLTELTANDWSGEGVGGDTNVSHVSLIEVKTGVEDDWYGHDGQIALDTGTGWEYTTMTEGMRVWVKDENAYYYHNGTAVVIDNAMTLAHTQNTDTKIVVADTEVSITDTGANGVISLKADNATKATVDAAGVKVTAFTTAGVVHNAVTTGLLSSSKIVAADVTAGTLTNTEFANLGTSGKIAKFTTTGLADGTNTDADVASAVTLKHTQNTDNILVVGDTSIAITDTTVASTLLIHFNGPDGQTTYTAETGQTVTFANQAQLDTAQQEFGTASLLLDGSDYCSVPDSTDWYFGTGNFTIDCWIRFAALPASNQGAFIVSQKSDGTHMNFFGLYNNAGQNTWYFSARDGSEQIAVMKNCTVVINVWYHVAITRSGNDFRIFQDGLQVGTTVTDTSEVPNIASELFIGSNDATLHMLNGWLDELRIIKGTAAWTADFTRPVLEYSAAIGGVITMKADNTAELTVDSDGLTLASGASINEFSTDGTMAGNSDDAMPTEKAVVTWTKGSYETVYETTLTEAASSITISSLTGDTDLFYRLVYMIKNTAAGASVYSLYPNNDTGNNCSHSRMYHQGSTASIAANKSGTATGIYCGDASAQNDYTWGEIICCGKSGTNRVFMCQFSAANAAGDSVTTVWNDVMWRNTANELTSLVFNSSRASSLGIGSYFRLETIRR